MDACPIILAMLSISMPAQSDKVPNVWRAMWKESPDVTHPAHEAQISIQPATTATAWEDKGVTFFFHRMFSSASVQDGLYYRIL